MQETLTNEQRALVEDNHGLIAKFMEENNLGEDEVEDWYGTCAVGLCMAAQNYLDFESFAYTYMKAAVALVLGMK